MSDEIEKHVLKKYDIVAKLGKGVSARAHLACPLPLPPPSRPRGATPHGRPAAATTPPALLAALQP
jgi:hypothetical protein